MQPSLSVAFVCWPAVALASNASSSHTVVVLVWLHMNWTTVSIATQFQKICVWRKGLRSSQMGVPHVASVYSLHATTVYSLIVYIMRKALAGSEA